MATSTGYNRLSRPKLRATLAHNGRATLAHDGRATLAHNGLVQPDISSARPLGSGRVRATRQGAAVDSVLRDAAGFRTAQDLHAELKRRGQAVGLTTVYRHLKTLADAGEIDVVHQPDGEAQYRLCGTAESVVGLEGNHHHHLVCRVCGRAVEVDGPEVEAWAERVAAQAGYTQISHTLEVFGLCPEHSAPR
jgi:Fur family ferric uptake transcriptional regulator